ncbi:hypothetical protein ACO22_02989 [Paracoccidioides brasiliensis]|uniref:Uncharacterized protein n=1 Tax=Paracoccidioides brasiliensis TaxID=121759 RepID=A0A1D2JH62_PARBR|nr:hypothetical protein ACO22_02989 [Paracoccidioides brasiliensis]ODH51191.1 hypothetical protein GX48_02618 [Paracoccidioides brasiliensis]
MEVGRKMNTSATANVTLLFTDLTVHLPFWRLSNLKLPSSIPKLHENSEKSNEKLFHRRAQAYRGIENAAKLSNPFVWNMPTTRKLKADLCKLFYDFRSGQEADMMFSSFKGSRRIISRRIWIIPPMLGP